MRLKRSTHLLVVTRPNSTPVEVMVGTLNQAVFWQEIFSRNEGSKAEVFKRTFYEYDERINLEEKW